MFSLTRHPERLCRECRERIPADARTCRYCGAHQNWRRFLTIGSTTLALVVAALSVFTTFLTVGLPLTKQDRAEISLLVETGGQSAIYLFAYNSGKRGAIARPAAFWIIFSTRPNSTQPSAVTRFDPDRSPSVYIGPGEEKTITADLDGAARNSICNGLETNSAQRAEERPTPTFLWAGMKCQVGITVTDFSAPAGRIGPLDYKKYKPIDVPCTVLGFIRECMGKAPAPLSERSLQEMHQPQAAPVRPTPD
jgi:hypothetical protein